MRTVDEHLEKARRNLAFLNTIDVNQDTFADWAIVVLFYRALHLISAVIHTNGSDHGRGHGERQRAVEAAMSVITAQEYERLYNRARIYRYERITATAAEYNKLFQSSFLPLFHEVQSLIPHAT